MLPDKVQTIRYTRRIVIIKKSRWAIIRPYIEVFLFILFVCLANAIVELLAR